MNRAKTRRNPQEKRRAETMKTWTEPPTLAALAVLFTLPLAGCAEDGPDSMTEADAPEPGDPAVYAPDGWPLQIGDRISSEVLVRLREFRTPGLSWGPAGIYPSLNLVGGRVYAPLIDVYESPFMYRGHFPVRFPESMRVQEPDMPPEFHGKIEYYTPPPIDTPFRIGFPNPLMWPDYDPERRK